MVYNEKFIAIYRLKEHKIDFFTYEGHQPSYVNYEDHLEQSDGSKKKSAGCFAKNSDIIPGYYERTQVALKYFTLDLSTFRASNPYMKIHNQFELIIDYVPTNSTVRGYS